MARNLSAPKLLSRRQADALQSQPRVCIKAVGGPGGITGFVLVLEQTTLREDGQRTLHEATTLAGWFNDRSQADEASVAVLTALNALTFWQR